LVFKVENENFTGIRSALEVEIILIRKSTLSMVDVNIWITACVILNTNNYLAVVAMDLIDIVLVHVLLNNTLNTSLRQENLNINIGHKIILA
jgi:hypothetical protein